MKKYIICLLIVLGALVTNAQNQLRFETNKASVVLYNPSTHHYDLYNDTTYLTSIPKKIVDKYNRGMKYLVESWQLVQYYPGDINKKRARRYLRMAFDQINTAEQMYDEYLQKKEPI